MNLPQVTASHNLVRRAATAMAWSYTGVAAFILLQVGANIAYARLLGPDQFGLFASGLLVTGILKVISDLGFGSALIQSQSIDGRDIRLIFARLMLAAALACALLITLSRPLSEMMREPRLIPVFRCFSLALIVFPISTICAALLARKLDQKHTQLANVLGYALGYCGAGIAAAIMGMGAWSPIFGFFSQLIINSAVLYWYARPDLRPLLGRFGADSNLTRFGLRVMLTNVSNWLIYSMDNLLVQRLFGTFRFSLYTVAYNVVRTPVDHVVQTLQSVLLPASAHIRDDKVRLARGYVAVLDATLLVTLPMFGTVAVISRTFIEALYGPHWAGAESVLAPLALAMPLQAISTVTSALLWGTGMVGKELRIQWVTAGLLLGAILLCAQISFHAVAWGVLFGYFFRSVLMMRIFSRFVGLTVKHTVTGVRCGTVVAVLVASLIWPLDQFLRRVHAVPVGNLLIEVGTAAVLWVGLVALLQRWLLSSELRSLAHGALGHMGPRMWFDVERKAV